MAELKTKRNSGSVAAFLKAIPGEDQRRDAKELLAFMKSVTKKKPEMWGTSIVGFGRYHYKYKTGREGDWFLAGFSPRKANMTVYVMCDLKTRREALAKLGKHKTGVGCLYFKRLEDIHLPTLGKLITEAIKRLPKTGNG